MANLQFNPGGAADLNEATKLRYEANPDTNAYDDASKAKVDALPGTVLGPSGALTLNHYLKSGGGGVVTGQATVPWGDVSGKPAIPVISGTPTVGQIAIFTSSTVLAGQTGLPFADLTGTPTTLAGYGITNGEPLMAVSVVSTTPVALADADNRRFRHLTHATPTVAIPAGLAVGTSFSFSTANAATLTAASGVTLNGVSADSVTLAPVPATATVIIVAADTAIVIGGVS